MVVALLCLVVAGFFVFALCSNLIYWYETLNSPEERIPSLRPGVVACLRQYGVTLGAYFVCVGLFPFGPLLRRRVPERRLGSGLENRRESEPKHWENGSENRESGPESEPGGERESGDGAPVVCIHGLNNNAAVWLYLGNLAAKAGFSVSTYSYSSLFVPLERIISGLEAHITAVEAAFPGKKPVLVCHSLGGLLARHWLERGGNRERVSGLVTLGTPHGGSKLAVLAPGRLAANIVPGSPFLESLRKAAPLPFPCVAFVSPADEAVLPASFLLPPDGWKMRVTAKVGHFSMLFRPSIGKQVLEELLLLTSTPD